MVAINKQGYAKFGWGKATQFLDRRHRKESEPLQKMAWEILIKKKPPGCLDITFVSLLWQRALQPLEYLITALPPFCS